MAEKAMAKDSLKAAEHAQSTCEKLDKMAKSKCARSGAAKLLEVAYKALTDLKTAKGFEKKLVLVLSAMAFIKREQSDLAELRDPVQDDFSDQNQQEIQNKKKESGKSNWASYNAKRMKAKANRLKASKGIPVHRLQGKQAVAPVPRRAIQFNVRRVDGPVETVFRVSRGTRTPTFKLAGLASRLAFGRTLHIVLL
eukprot:s416_g1.t1